VKERNKGIAIVKERNKGISSVKERNYIAEVTTTLT
jgi:hypothetical protein